MGLILLGFYFVGGVVYLILDLILFCDVFTLLFGFGFVAFTFV